MTTRGTWAFPPRVSPLGGVALVTLEESLRQSLDIILRTARGERVMRPTFGLGIHEYAFEVINVATLDLMRVAIRDGLLSHEPRLAEVDVSISTRALGEGELLVSLRYRALGTSALQELTHAFSMTH